MDVPIDYHVWGTMLGHYQGHMPKWANVRPRKKTILSTIQNDLLHKFTDKAIVSFMQQTLIVCCCNWWGTDIENSLFKYRVSYGHLTFMIKTFELLMKSCKKLICYSCIFHVQLHVHLKKWTVKFKLLYPRNYISYFNKICRICCVNIRIQSLKIWRKFVLPWLKYSIFARGFFFMVHPVHVCVVYSVRDHYFVGGKLSLWVAASLLIRYVSKIIKICDWMSRYTG